MYKNRKAQGALEFLLTYGWAFMIILIMIGALAYFGVLNPSKLLPDKCTFPPPFDCDSGGFSISNVAVADNDALRIRLLNNFGASVTITSASLETDFMGAGACTMTTYDSSPNDGDCDAGGSSLTNYVWPEGKSLVLCGLCATSQNLPEGEKIKMTMTLNWYPTASGAGITKRSIGEVYGTVQ